MSFVFMVFLVLMTVAMVGYGLKYRAVFVACGAFACGGMSYFTIGIMIPRFSGVGHFYSVPLGRLSVGDWDILLSLVFWLALWGIALDRIYKWRARPRPG